MCKMLYRYRYRVEGCFVRTCNRFLADNRRSKLNNTDFSIISNNCWGGSVYRHYGIPYLSPTVGLYRDRAFPYIREGEDNWQCQDCVRRKSVLSLNFSAILLPANFRNSKS